MATITVTSSATSDATAQWVSVAQLVKERIENAIPAHYYMDPALIPQNLDDSVIDLPRKSGVLTAREIEITELTATLLLPKIWGRIYTSVEVTQAFCKRAAIAHQLVFKTLLFIHFDTMPLHA